MPVPTGLTLTFDQPSYPAGAIMTATLAGTGANTSAASFTLAGVITDTATGEQSDVTGAYVVDEPSALTGAVTDASGRTWTAAAPAVQDGQAFTQMFNATA